MIINFMEGPSFNVVLFWWLISLPSLVVSQLPEEANVVSPRPLGKCSPLRLWELGNFDSLSTNGLIPRTLLTIAMAREQGSALYTREAPSVQLIDVAVTCQSSDPVVSQYNTMVVSVHYTCRGVACPNALNTVRYSHQFSFVCNDANQFTTWDYVPGFNIHIRQVSHSIPNSIISREGSCSLCTNDPAFLSNPRYNPMTGCVACKPQCYRIGLGRCSTNIGASDMAASCCSYWYLPPGSAVSCVKNCMLPIGKINHTNNICGLTAILERTARSSGFTDVLCDGDDLNFRCFNSYPSFRLSWGITLPGQETTQRTYDPGTTLNQPQGWVGGIITALQRIGNQGVLTTLSIPVTGGSQINGIRVTCSINFIPFGAGVELQRSTLTGVPLKPLGIRFTQYPHTNPFLKTVMLQWNSSSQSMVQWYTLEISPQTPSPFEATQSLTTVTLPLQLDTDYVASLKAVNCIGDSPTETMAFHLAPPTVISVYSTSPHILVSNIVRLPFGYTGVALTCLAFGFPELPIVNWFKVTRNGRQMLPSNNFNGGDSRYVTAQLAFLDGFSVNDEADYMCSTQSSNASTVFNVRPGTVSENPSSCLFNTSLFFFQVRVFDTRCGMWDENERDRAKVQFLRLLKGLALLPTNSDNILLLQNGLSCSANVPNAALFRGVITDNRAGPTVTGDIYCGTKSWLELGPTLLLGDTVHQVDRDCVFRIPTQFEPECASNASASRMNIAAIASSVVVVIMLACAGAVGIALAIFFIRKKKASKDGKKPDKRKLGKNNVYSGSMYEDNDDTYYNVAEGENDDVKYGGPKKKRKMRDEDATTHYTGSVYTGYTAATEKAGATTAYNDVQDEDNMSSQSYSMHTKKKEKKKKKK